MLPVQPPFERIALNRVTFGARDREVTAVTASGWPAWVENQLRPPSGDDPDLAQYIQAQTMEIAYPAYDAMGLKWPATKEDRPFQYLKASGPELWRAAKDVLSQMAAPEQLRPHEELASVIAIRNTHSLYQLREFMADFWLNHFSVWYNKDYLTRPQLIVYDRDIVRPNVFGNFRQLLEGIATSTSMLNYLDNADSGAVIPNENYARELMELHTMGRDAYLGKNTDGVDRSATGFTDDDILHASRALSGWTFKKGQWANSAQMDSTGEFFFNPQQHNTSAGRCLGFDLASIIDGGMAQGRKVLDLVADHPATATFICTKLCRRIFGDTPPQAVIDRAVAAWTANRTRPDQIKRVLQAILLDGPEIGTGPSVKVRRPYERMIALARATESVIKPHQLWRFMLNQANDDPFGWPTPDGRPDTNAFWLNTATNVAAWTNLQYMTYSTYAVTDFAAQTPLDVAKSATLTAEYWVGRIIGYALSSDAMDAITQTTQRVMNSYSYDPRSFQSWFGGQVIAGIATAPEFVLR